MATRACVRPLKLSGCRSAGADGQCERLGVPEEIAEDVSFLAGPARWINGQTIYANGGII
jgi:NAD(P)-dependent dehydrogenase (short-subunit alcohol dehydrogenase family)